MMISLILLQLLTPIFFKLVIPLSLIPHGIILLYLDKSVDIFKEKPW